MHDRFYSFVETYMTCTAPEQPNSQQQQQQEEGGPSSSSMQIAPGDWTDPLLLPKHEVLLQLLSTSIIRRHEDLVQSLLGGFRHVAPENQPGVPAAASSHDDVCCKPLPPHALFTWLWGMWLHTWC